MRRLDIDTAIDKLQKALDNAEERCYVDSETGSNYDEGYMTLKDGVIELLQTLYEAKEYEWEND